jgi:hypothetical protein
MIDVAQFTGTAWTSTELHRGQGGRVPPAATGARRSWFGIWRVGVNTPSLTDEVKPVRHRLKARTELLVRSFLCKYTRLFDY